jgi:hypothetical protein
MHSIISCERVSLSKKIQTVGATFEYSGQYGGCSYVPSNPEWLWYRDHRRLNNSHRHDAIDGDEPEMGFLQVYQLWLRFDG